MAAAGDERPPPAAAVLEYRNPRLGRDAERPRGRRVWHVWLLPLLWLPGAAASTVYYGDEYGGWALSNLPALGLLLPLGVERLLPNGAWGFAAIACVGLLIVSVTGFLMDRLRVRRLMPYALCSFLAALGFIGVVAESGRPWARGHWSEFALPLFCAIGCWAAYLSGALSILIAFIALLWRRWGPNRHADSDRTAGG